jgi:alanine racemase
MPPRMQAVLTIDLGAVVANWRLLSGLHGGGAVAAVVKADAYGLGAAPVARALRDAGCAHFFVAHLEEGVALRAEIGPGPMIAVLNGFAPGADGADGLTPVLNTLADVASRLDRPGTAGAILHVDTGMARLGLDAREQARLAENAGRLRRLPLRFVLSHLACAEQPAHPMNTAQAERFAGIAARIAPGVPRSLANSAGLFLGHDFRLELARPGCALYGINPTPGRPNPMRPVVTLEAPVLQVRDVPAGASVGYGATWVATRPTRIATVAAGYADGYLRALSGRASGLVEGICVPLVGRVSMDLLTFDVTDVLVLEPGAMVRLIGGDGHGPDELAAAAGTIGYEILTALGARYLRRYLPA